MCEELFEKLEDATIITFHVEAGAFIFRTVLKPEEINGTELLAGDTIVYLDEYEDIFYNEEEDEFILKYNGFTVIIGIEN